MAATGCAVASLAATSALACSKLANAASVECRSSCQLGTGFLQVLPASVHSRTRDSRRATSLRISAAQELSVSAGAEADSVIPEVAALKDEAETTGVSGPTTRKVSPLAKGGTLSGAAAAGKAPAPTTLGMASLLSMEGEFSDPRWKEGTWDISEFTVDGVTNWDAVIDAEVVRRKWLEANPESTNSDKPIVFDTSIVPWWAWVRRFHLPEAEKLNGRAAMLGFMAAYLVDSATGVGLVDQMDSFFGKLLLTITLVATLFVRKNEDLEEFKKLADEWTFYDKQWQATWKEGPPPTGSEKKDESA